MSSAMTPGVATRGEPQRRWTRSVFTLSVGSAPKKNAPGAANVSVLSAVERAPMHRQLTIASRRLSMSEETTTDDHADELSEDVHSGVFETDQSPEPDEELQDRVARAQEAERLAANADLDADDEEIGLAATIVANSEHYNTLEEVLEDFPTLPSLKTKKKGVARHAEVPGTTQSHPLAANVDDELTDDVSSGVFD